MSVKNKITIGDLYTYAKTSACYSDFMMQLGKFVGIPPTDIRVMDITLDDLCESKKQPDTEANAKVLI